MGPFGHASQITFSQSGNYITEKHSYTVLEDLKKRFRFVYAFMHCNNNALDHWLAEELERKRPEIGGIWRGMS